MAERISERPRKPRSRLSEKPGYFYPAEVARILGWANADYAQMRAVLKLVRPQARQPDRKWARYDVSDLASIRIAIELAGGVGVLAPGRRLRLRPIHEACVALRLAGFERPLLEVPLARHGRRVVALVKGVVFEPTTGQLVARQVSADIEQLLTTHQLEGDVLELRQPMAAEHKGLERARAARAGRRPGSGPEWSVD